MAALALVALLAATFVAVAPTASVSADGNEAPANPYPFRSVTAGDTHSCALVHGGAVKCWGGNASGQLGIGDTASRGDFAGEMGDTLPTVRLGAGRSASAISAGSAHTCALLDNAKIACWGDNANGRLGIGSVLDRGDGPDEMGAETRTVNLQVAQVPIAVSAGGAHTCALLTGGGVACWGRNTSGQLGVGNNLDRMDTAGEIAQPVTLGTGRTATAIAAGGSHTCALLDNGTVKCWGENGLGQLGLGTTADKGDGAGEMGDSLNTVSLGTGRTATAITAGQNHTCARLDNGTVKCWGSNANGLLGLGDTLSRGDAGGEMGDNLPAVALGSGRTATGIVGGALHTCAVLDNASVKCWGSNGTGRLGLGDTQSRGDGAGEMGNSLPVVSLGTGRTATALAVGDGQTCAVLDDRSVKCWGVGALGRLGSGDTLARGDAAGEMGDALPVVDLGIAGRPAIAITAGGAHSCALLDDATVKCWGFNGNGRLGLGDTLARGDGIGEMGDSLPVVALGTGRTATAVSAGTDHTCALLDDGTVKCWGNNANGQLGLGDTASRGDAAGEMGDSLPAISLGTGRTATAISAGAQHTCALLDNGSVKCWGFNSSGQLGIGNVANRGDGAGEMGNTLPAVSLGSGRTATAISAGGGHTCAVLDNATVKCWGSNSLGRLGLGDTDNRGDAVAEMGNVLPAVSLGTGRTATAVSAGGSHTCARLDDATVKCWGNNTSGRLGLGDFNHRGDGPGEMGDTLAAVSVGTGRTVTAVAAGGDQTCVRLDDASMKCWGAGATGRLGLGDVANRGDGAGEMGDALPSVSLGTGRSAATIATGNGASCALLDDASVRCWGSNTSGRLGLEDTIDRGDAAGEMGDALPRVDLGSEVPGTITGTISAVGGGSLAGAFVLALRATNFSVATGAVANGSGNYTMEAAAGSYFLYLIDPQGRHAAGFSPGNPIVAVTSGGTVDADGSMAPTRGSVTGTIRETGPNTPLSGQWAISLDSTGTPERGVLANNAGAFTLPGLNPGGHFITYVDPSGAHGTRFFPNSPTVPGATLVNVTAGASTVADGSVPTQASIGSSQVISGTVTEEISGNPLASVFVIALKASDFSLARGAITNGAGVYTLNLDAGDYMVVFLDSTGLHDTEWHDDQPATGLGTATPVTAPSVTNAVLGRNTGSMSGTVTDAPSGAPLGGAWVLAIGPSGIAGGTVTAGDGTYSISGLAPGSYRAAFLDPVGGRALEYFDNSPDFGGATAFAIFAGLNQVKDAALALP